MPSIKGQGLARNILTLFSAMSPFHSFFPFKREKKKKNLYWLYYDTDDQNKRNTGLFIKESRNKIYLCVKSPANLEYHSGRDFCLFIEKSSPPL